MALIGASGCFYFDDINQRPSLEIKLRVPPGSDGFTYRGDNVILDAIADDPEGQVVAFRWTVFACHDASDVAACDAEPLSTSVLEFAQFDVPQRRADPDGEGPIVAPPTEQLLVVLEGTDAFGATAKPHQELTIVVRDVPPEVVVFDDKPYDGVEGTPIDLFVEYGDADDTADNVAIEWQAFSPSLVEINLTDLANVPQPHDPTKHQVGKRLIPNAQGTWEIRVTATDSLGESTVVEHLVEVIADLPPCLDQLSPGVPPSGATLPVTEPTLFQALVVADALDRFPTLVGDPFAGATTFSWSTNVNGGPRVAVPGTPGNSLAFDPANFTLGDVVELRVQVMDRNQIQVPCADSDSACSIGANQCFQRTTWNVEVR